MTVVEIKAALYDLFAARQQMEARINQLTVELQKELQNGKAKDNTAETGNDRTSPE